MAKRSKKRQVVKKQLRVTRRLQPFANRLVVTPQIPLAPVANYLADNRFYAPPVVRRSRPQYTLSFAPVAPRERNYNVRLPSVPLPAPTSLRLCVRRKQRREVIFAKTGGGNIRRSRRNRINVTSSISCKG